MRSFLSKVLLTIFVVVFILPTSLLAQENNWTPPVGAPTIGTNTPSPINIGPNFQTKAGPLRVNGTLTAGSDLRVNGTLTAGSDLSVEVGSNLKGFTFFDTAGQGNDFMASFVPAVFLNRVDIGQQTDGVDVNIFGRLKYKPTNLDGSPVNGSQPQAGKVLKSSDDSGNIVWGTAIPDGGTDGDTLIWDETCNCWVTGPVTNTGAALPVGTIGQTMWYNGTSWEATDRVKHFLPSSGVLAETRITNDRINLFGSQRVDIGAFSTGQTIINSPQTTISGSTAINIGNDSLGETTIKSPTVTFAENGPAQQSVSFRSNSVNFGIGSTYQEVSFDSNVLKIRGQSDFGQGRIPYSVDADGTFKWNKNFTYGEAEVIPGLNIGQLTLTNPQNGLGIFANQGMTWLGNDATISENGSLFLEGLDVAENTDLTDGLVKHLCYVETTKKVVKCPASTTGGGGGYDGEFPVNGPPRGPGNGSVMYTFEDNDFRHQFNFTGTVTVKYCGAGGGGGGGGIGAPGQLPSMDSWGTGGSGGGGGEAGKCFTEEINVTPGSSLGWNIGQGGLGGYGAAWSNNSVGSSSENNNAYPGQTGGTTSIMFDPTGSTAEAQVGQTAQGGFGGGKGGSVREGLQGGLPLIGLHGNLALSTGSYAWGFNGSAGATINTAPCESCGGIGGWGESFDTDGNLRTGLTGNQTSARGGGGTPGGTDSYTDRFGKSGYCGAPGHGGGGGGGGFGGYYRSSPLDQGFKFRGGAGGCGGGGYVFISGLPTSNPNSGEIVYSTPGTHSLTTFQENNTIPADVETFTVEVWGAGGGAGGVQEINTAVRRGGGGGSGGYRSVQISRTALFNAQFIVGAKGINGTSTPAGTSATSGTNGGDSRVVTGSVDIFGGRGGAGGAAQNASGSPAGGSGGGTIYSSFTQAPYGADGLDGSWNGGPCNLSTETITPNNGFGAGAPRTCTDPTLNVYQGSAQDGRIRISW